MMKTLSQAQVIEQVRRAGSIQLRWPAVIEVVYVILLLIAIISVSLVARVHMPAYIVDLTAPSPTDQLNLVGFHSLEQHDGLAYHWSSGYAFVQLPSGYNAAPAYIAAVRTKSAHPDAPQPLTFLANERILATVTPSTAFRTYHVVLPPALDNDKALRFALQTPSFSPPGDMRDLGVIVTGITLQPVPHREWTVALVLALGFLLLWVWLRWRGSSVTATLVFCAILSLPFLALYALYRPAPLGYLWLASMALLASAWAVLLAKEPISRLALALLATLVSFSGMLWPSWFSDDALISFRYAQNLVAGHGLVYNIGERVEGYTNFLWTILAALVLVLQRDPVFWAYVAGVVLALVILLLTYWTARHVSGPAWALVAALIVATSQNMLIHTARGAGLETGLFTLLALAGSMLYLSWWSERRPRAAVLCGGVFALASLTRPEGMLLMGLTVLHLLLTTYQRPLFADAIRSGNISTVIRILGASIQRQWACVRGPVVYLLTAYLLIIVPYFLWRIFYYGDVLPNTFYAKTGGGGRQVVRGLEYVWMFAISMGGPFLLMMFVPLVANWRATIQSWRGYFLLLVSVYSIYIIVVGGDHFYGARFFVPLIPWLAILIADGLAWVYHWFVQRDIARSLAPVVLAIGLFVFSGYALTRSMPIDTTMRGLDESVWIWREMGWWMLDHADPHESIAVMGAGAVAYYSDHTVIDLLGLNEKYIARVEVENMGSGAAGHEKRAPAYVLDVRRPTYIPRMWDDYFGGENVLQKQYQLIDIRTRYGRELQFWKRLP